jgi:hypothetical protein
MMEMSMSDQPPNPAAPRRPLSPAQLATLKQANQLLANGQPGQAAPLFAQLAGQMESSQWPRRAANVHALAAHAFADSRAGQAALVEARSALNLFIQNQMTQRTPRFYANITRKLRNKSMPVAAQSLEQEFGSRIGALPSQPAAAPASRRGSLPTSCPKCGAPVHGRDANWIDDNTAECDYCGVLIRAGS